ncbi:3-oxoacyl-ACP synthase [Maribellus sediminis]|uniref:3-oxoacyl-ACP synthase n=1 Tax=Maribellus sediminis TaxID=2696285 RepID=UPI00142FFEF0|nr:3-oxoacyl-ACP synthase [Maribellus sediminis]
MPLPSFDRSGIFVYFACEEQRMIPNKLSFKTQLIDRLTFEIDKKIQLLHEAIAAAKESRDNETKSSVGDKYETGRAMVQMEIEKNQAQLSKTEAFKNSLTKIDSNTQVRAITFGSLVLTSQGLYFFALPYGKIEVEGTPVFCLSLASPIGQALAGKSIGESVIFQGRELKILELS